MPPYCRGQVGASQPFAAKRAIPVCDLVEQRPLLAHVAQALRAVRLDPGSESMR